MEFDYEFWKVRQLALLLDEFEISNRKIQGLVMRLKECYDKRKGGRGRVDGHLRISVNAGNQVCFFRTRGDCGECEICGKYINILVLALHLKKDHNLSVNY